MGKCKTSLENQRKVNIIILKHNSMSKNGIEECSMLIRHSHRHSASLGALVVLLAIAIDPLSQLLLSIEYRSVDATNEHGIDGIPRAERYALWGYGTTQSGVFLFYFIFL